MGLTLHKDDSAKKGGKVMYQCNCGEQFNSREERTTHSVSCPTMAEPKQLELKRISDGEIDKCIDPKYVYAFNYDLSPIAQAQLQADQQVLDNVKQAIFDEMSEEMPTKHHENEAFKHKLDDCLLCWWQALKKKWLK